VAQVVECLLFQGKALNSNPSATKKKKKKEKKERNSQVMYFIMLELEYPQI
jgi:hypothetical protein